MFIPSTVKIRQLVKTVTWYHMCNKHQVKIQAFCDVMQIHCDIQNAGGLWQDVITQFCAEFCCGRFNYMMATCADVTL
jgi:hypothetical protein